MNPLRYLPTHLAVLVAVFASMAFAQPQSSGTAMADASEIFENLSEASATVDEAGLKKALAAFEVLRPALAKSLSAERRNALDAAVAGAREGWQRQDRGAVALQSIEAFRVLQEAIDRKGQRVPVEVSLLDYAGFKTKALLVSPSPDWGQAAKTVQEASGWWPAIRSRVKDQALQAAMDHAVSGLKDAAARKDPALLAFAAELDLILVDGLEVVFSAH